MNSTEVAHDENELARHIGRQSGRQKIRGEQIFATTITNETEVAHVENELDRQIGRQHETPGS